MRELAKRTNDGKLPFDLIDPLLDEGVAEVLQFGADKYAPNNWKLSINSSDHHQFVQDRLGSLMRHLSEYRKGSYNDNETGLTHLAHAACNLMFLMRYDMEELPTHDS